MTGCSKPAMQYYGNTMNMVHHLQTFHPKENAEYLGRNVVGSAATPLTSFPKKMLSLSDQRVKTITRLIVDVIIKDLRPVNIIDGAGFSALIAHAYPEYLLAPNHYYMDRMNDVHAVESTKLIESLKEVDSTLYSHHCRPVDVNST